MTSDTPQTKVLLDAADDVADAGHRYPLLARYAAELVHALEGRGWEIRRIGGGEPRDANRDFEFPRVEGGEE